MTPPVCYVRRAAEPRALGGFTQRGDLGQVTSSLFLLSLDPGSRAFTSRKKAEGLLCGSAEAPMVQPTALWGNGPHHTRSSALLCSAIFHLEKSRKPRVQPSGISL